MIRYSLTKDKMNPETGGYIAKVKQWEKTDIDDIMDYFVPEGTGLTRPQALAYFEKLMQSIEHFIEIRGSVTTPLFRIQTTISGVFRNKGDKFDPKRHHINLRIVPGTRLENMELPPGNYTIVVQAIMRRHKSIRGGALQKLITVV